VCVCGGGGAYEVLLPRDRVPLKVGEFLHQLSDYQFLNKDSVIWNELLRCQRKNRDKF